MASSGYDNQEKTDIRGAVPPPYPAGQGGLPQYGQGPAPTAQYLPNQNNVQPTATHTVVFAGRAPGTLGPDPTYIQCSSCNQQVLTAISYENGTATWVGVLVLTLVGCVFGCCLIPLCVDGAKDVVHTCPNCRNFLGRYRRM